MRAFLASLLLCAGCNCSSAPAMMPCSSGAECPSGMCVDGFCVPVSDAGRLDAAPGDGGIDARIAICDSGVVCEGVCCGLNQRCAYMQCVVDLGPCTSNDDCAGDSYCDADQRCTPYGVPPSVTNDPACERSITIGDFTPDVQCRWTGQPASDPTNAFRNVYSAPMVADFDLDDDPSVLAPSIVIATFAGDVQNEGGILRLLDGRTCEVQTSAPDRADRLIYASNNAIGDLDGASDRRPEIVGTSLSTPGAGSGLIAFKIDPATRQLVRLWYGRRCDQPGEPRHTPNDQLNNNGPSIHDLDDDGVPEVLYDRFVYDNNGCLLNPGATYDNYLRLGLFSVVADVDLDGSPELVRHDGVYAWSGTDWTLEPYWAPPAGEVAEATRMGHVAVADLGDFPGAVGDAPGRAEIVVASAPSPSSPSTDTGSVRVMTIGGDVVFGPIALPNEPSRIAGRGGPPTIGDFDGDGRRELAVAGGSRYTVFDLDCDLAGDTGPGCARAAGLPRGVLWSRPSQDVSSNVTGSSVFDFDADGVAEVAYGDECYVRIYRGTDGEVLFSASASSGTGYEYPVIADVDGDYNSEIVIALTTGVTCPATDPIFTRGTSTFANSNGIVVLRDVMDRWAASRPIWNQHAYSVTNVNDDGTIPRTSAWMRNFSDATLNNFRMNAQGSLERRGAADLTASLARAADLCDATTGEVTLAANVCNRGTNPVPDGARVVFYAGDPDGGAAIACETTLPRLLDPSTCTEVSCDWTIPSEPGMERVARSVTVVVDPDGSVFECRDGNNRGIVPDIYCSPIF
ncbi:MAG: hypothetical protein IT378_17045 [Sandaracinaceae bacterium]|nr:hypothetical protein [Sandaracinaceae bacterium]